MAGAASPQAARTSAKGFNSRAARCSCVLLAAADRGRLCGSLVTVHISGCNLSNGRNAGPTFRASEPGRQLLPSVLDENTGDPGYDGPSGSSSRTSHRPDVTPDLASVEPAAQR